MSGEAEPDRVELEVEEVRVASATFNIFLSAKMTRKTILNETVIRNLKMCLKKDRKTFKKALKKDRHP